MAFQQVAFSAIREQDGVKSAFFVARSNGKAQLVAAPLATVSSVR
jgi:hypothetical protein